MSGVRERSRVPLFGSICLCERAFGCGGRRCSTNCSNDRSIGARASAASAASASANARDHPAHSRARALACRRRLLPMRAAMLASARAPRIAQFVYFFIVCRQRACSSCAPVSRSLAAAAVDCIAAVCLHRQPKTAAAQTSSRRRFLTGVRKVGARLPRRAREHATRQSTRTLLLGDDARSRRMPPQ